jgi:hypothetical protein
MRVSPMAAYRAVKRVALDTQRHKKLLHWINQLAKFQDHTATQALADHLSETLPVKIANLGGIVK